MMLASQVKDKAPTKRDLEIEDDNMLNSLKNQGLLEGALIAVKWDVLDKEAGLTSEVWFKGKIKNFLGFEIHLLNSKVFKELCKPLVPERFATFSLDYEELDEFPACTKKIGFTENGKMFDLEEKEYLSWIFQSELNNVQTSDPEVSISDLIKEQELLDEEFGCVHDEGLSAFKMLPHEKQISLALGYREFADYVKDKLREIQAKKGSEHVFTGKEIQDLLADLLAKKEQDIF
ncbi:uncharacterized protein LOC135146068 [Zophobas morio]|uniref:uncharacterized protein LOC135146068 n=1 Tax=Zophobas morio TaxID=2755281 RepID=UPI00308336C7